MIYSIYYVVYNIEYIVYSTFVSTIMARTPPRMLCRRMLVLKVSRAPPPQAGVRTLGFYRRRGCGPVHPTASSGSGQGPHILASSSVCDVYGASVMLYCMLYIKKNINLFLCGTLYLSHIAYRIQYVVCSV